MRERLFFWSALLGNLFEHYDAALFGFLSPFLAPLIFPNHDPVSALILTYAMIPLGMLARPIGSLVFGHIGDNYGRGRALFLALFGMGVVSLLIALTPTYTTIGIAAPIIFCLGRVAQNFLSSGESMGGAIFLLENSKKERHDILSSLFNASTIAGILLASFGVALLSGQWRLLYILGCVTALFGALLRKKIPEAPFKKAFSWRIFWQERRALSLIIITSGFAYANYSMALVLMNGFIPLVSTFTKTEMIRLNSLLLIFDFALLPLFGYLATKISRERVMQGAALLVIIFAIPLMLLLNGANFWILIFVRMCFVMFGVAFFAPYHAWAQSLLPKEHRYAIISFGYAVGSQLFGGGTAAISLWLFKNTGLIASISWYWMLLATCSFLVLRRRKALVTV